MAGTSLARRSGTWLLRGLPPLAIADWFALRFGLLSHPPSVLALFVLAWMLVLLIPLAETLRDHWAGKAGRLAVVGRTLLISGILLALGGGLVNWARALQGFVVLLEGEGVPLHQGSHLQEFVPGPLSSISEMDMVVLLEELELIPRGPDGFYPRSHITIDRRGEEPRRLALSPHESGSVGSLRFFQGAFGFAPRIVLENSGETIFDEVVAFETDPRGRSGISFSGTRTLPELAIELRGFMTLPESVRGHPTLELAVLREGKLLGRGSLLPGHFAELADGYRLGFTGVPMWSEVDISRRNYREVVLIGVAFALLGAILWPLASWRQTR